MSMAMKGFDYRQIINFYYTGVSLADISEAKAKDK
jgi:peptidoglycan hydrolase-like amidase